MVSHSEPFSESVSSGVTWVGDRKTNVVEVRIIAAFL